MYFQMAWRNIWRNPRRTAVILIAIVLGVWSMIFFGALMRGMIDSIIANGISTLTGHFKVYADGYRKDPVVRNSIVDAAEVEATVAKELPEGAILGRRVRVEAMVSNARHSLGAELVGVEPANEPSLSFIGDDVIVEGRFLKPDDRYVAVAGKALLEQFGTHVGNRLLLAAVDGSGELSSRSFEIVGAYHAELEQTEKTYVFIPMAEAQEMLGMGDAISELTVVLPREPEAAALVDRLNGLLPEGYTALSWRELIPTQVAFLNLTIGFMGFWDVIIFIAIGFGIVNTMLMAIFERMWELGMLRALGMRPRKIVREVVTESTLLLLIGAAIGNVLGWISVLPFARSGLDLSIFAAGMDFAGSSRIVYPVTAAPDVAMANFVVIGLGILICLYPAIKAARFKPVEAMAQA